MITVRWRLVQPKTREHGLATENAIGHLDQPWVVFEEFWGSTRDSVRSMPLSTWESWKAKREENGVTFERMPDLKETTGPDLPKKTKGKSKRR